MTNQAEQTEQRPVVVGIEGSERSTGALEWAASYAQATGTTVRAVAVWHSPSTIGFDVGGGAWDRRGRVQKDSRETGGFGGHPPPRALRSIWTSSTAGGAGSRRCLRERSIAGGRD